MGKDEKKMRSFSNCTIGRNENRTVSRLVHRRVARKRNFTFDLTSLVARKISFDICQRLERRSGRPKLSANGVHSFVCGRDVIGAFVTTFSVRVTLAAAPQPQTVQSERVLNAVLHTMLLHSARICVERGKIFHDRQASRNR